MKVFLPAVYILTVATLVYTADPQQVKQFYSGIVNCANSMHLPREPSPPIIECMLYRINLIDHYTGEIRRFEVLNYLGNIISNEYNLRKAQDMVTACFNYVDQTGRHDVHEDTMEIIKCSAPVLEFIDIST